MEERLTVSEVALAMDISVSMASRLLKIARDEGLIQESVLHPDELPIGRKVDSDAVRQVEDGLARHLHLRRVIALPVPEIFASANSFDTRRDDSLSRWLGNEGGRYLAPLVRGGDSIGIGYGRSVRAFVDGFRRENVGPRDLTLVSLAAGISVYPYSHGDPFDVSADGLALVLGHTLGAAARVVVVGRRGYSSQPKQWKWVQKPSIAVVGLGVVESGIFNCFEQRRYEMDDDGLALAEGAVAKAEAIRNRVTTQRIRPWGAEYYPLADFLGRPFVVEPPDDVRSALPPGELAELESVSGDLAQRIYAAPAEDLAEIEQTVLIAGGRRKAFAIWDFLTRFLSTLEHPRRHSLITDYWTATDVLRIARGARRLGPTARLVRAAVSA